MHEQFRLAVVDFETYIHGRNRSDRTAYWYTCQLYRFGEFLEGRNRLPSEITSMDILGFLAYERKRGLTDRSVDARYRALRAFFRWVERYGYLGGLANPVTSDCKPKVKVRIKRSIKRKELQQLLDSIQGETWIDARDRALISVLFRTGLRRGETAGLRVSDLDFAERRLLIHADSSKSAADAMLPFDKETARLLRDYLACRPSHPTDANILWYASDGCDRVKVPPLTGDGIYQVTKRRCAQAGLPRFNPQSFRRGFGSALLNVGVNIEEVSALLRHSSVKITETWYVEHELQALERVYHDAQERLR